MGQGTSLLSVGLATGIAVALTLGASSTWAQVNTVIEPAAEKPAAEAETTKPAAEDSADGNREDNAPEDADPANSDAETPRAVELGADDARSTDRGNEFGDDKERPVRVSSGLRLRDLDARIAALREERSQYGIGGPITMMSLGGATVLIAAVVAVGANSYCASSVGCNNDVGYGPYVAMGIGAGVGIWGAVLLSERLGPRRELGTQIHELEREKDYLKYEMRLTPSLTATTAGLELNVTF